MLWLKKSMLSWFQSPHILNNTHNCWTISSKSTDMKLQKFCKISLRLCQSIQNTLTQKTGRVSVMKTNSKNSKQWYNLMNVLCSSIYQMCSIVCCLLSPFWNLFSSLQSPQGLFKKHSNKKLWYTQKMLKFHKFCLIHQSPQAAACHLLFIFPLCVFIILFFIRCHHCDIGTKIDCFSYSRCNETWKRTWETDL